MTWLKFTVLLLLAAPLMANGDQCGAGKSGCSYGFHDCGIKNPQHSGKHRCRNCGDSF